MLNSFLPAVIRRFASKSFKKFQYRTLKVDAPIPLEMLISPLRYDIIVRQQYFDFFRKHRKIFDCDFPRYLSMARNTSYFVWFREIVCVRFLPHLLNDRDAFETAFVRRIQDTAALHDSFCRRGMDPRHPIRLLAGKKLLPTDSGKIVIRNFYAGDGCHRLALLRLNGITEVRPEWVRVKFVNKCKPLDNTLPLISSLRLSPANYYRFLSLGYGDIPLSSREQLRIYVARKTPELLTELDHILAIDEKALKPLNP